MAIGPYVRGLLGPLEIPVANMYREFFFNMESLARLARRNFPAEEILEVGCGEGALIEQLAKVYPRANLTGLDITPRVGRLFRGDLSRVRFFQETIREHAKTNSQRYDLVCLCDVMHHIPWEMHGEILHSVRQTLRPGGRLLLKDWEKQETLIHYLGYFSDRHLTGDQIRYGTASDFRKLINRVFGPNHIVLEHRFRPWNNNMAFLVRN